MYAQGWVPMLDDQTAKSLLDRTGLAGDYEAKCPACDTMVGRV